MLSTSLERHVLRISLFAHALVESLQGGVIDLLSVGEGVLLSQNNLVGAAIAKDVINLLCL